MKVWIASQNKREICGVSLGFTGGHSIKQNMSTHIAEPRIVANTWQYIPLAVKFSNLQKKMAKQAGFQLFDESEYPDRLKPWAQEIHKEMINELFSILFLVHDDSKSKAFSHWLLKHTDQQNFPD
jgi:hypothetical protein